MSLRTAFEKNDIKRIQAILQDQRNDIFREHEVSQYLEDLLRNIRLKVLQQKVQPYRTVKIEYLAAEINISEREVRQLLSELILEEKIDGQIDQLTGFLELNQSDAKESRYRAMDQWASALVNIHMNLTQ